MGKIPCQICGKKCKGEVLKLEDKYFHTDCFKCKECNTQLSEGEFFLKDGKYYCPSDYQKLFGTRCFVCRKFVEGEVVTALGNTFHQECFKCKNCSKSFHAGDKVSFSGSDYYCKPCAEQIESPHSPGSPHREKNHVSRPVLRTSTPRRNVDGQDGVDQNDEVITPTENQLLQYRTPSPGSSSMGSRSSSSSFHRQSRTESDHDSHDVNFGKMYPKSYLEAEKEEEKKLAEAERRKKRDMYKRSSSPAPNPPKSPHFHRPENFHFSRVRQAYVCPGGKKGHVEKGMMVLANEAPPRGKSPTPMNKEEPIKLSTYPDGHEPEPDEQKRIERDDWPGPPSSACILPELMRNKLNTKIGNEDDDEEDEGVFEDDPKIQREIEEISKYNKSGISQVILRDLEEKKKKKRSKSPPLDPWRASRTPSADHEPEYKTRYDSPIFALAKPGYTFGLAAKSASLPGSARAGVSLGEYEGVNNGGERVQMRHTPYNASSTSMDGDGSLRTTDYIIRGGGRYHGAHYSEVLNHTPTSIFFRRSLPNMNAEPHKAYSYEDIKVTKELPKDVDRNCLEKYLTKEDFEKIFNMNREEFYRMAEWRRNDLKKRVELY
ncbi:actin-binding LIM protein 1-like isoform X12 [Tubulanus polymorphus]|uniref:actin-binding LIM protein 1-like isoform X12 n=1 Tax=Tubulanus polymorphus TaxID=672921 RepID=UPI003DA292E4